MSRRPRPLGEVGDGDWSRGGAGLRSSTAIRRMGPDQAREARKADSAWSTALAASSETTRLASLVSDGWVDDERAACTNWRAARTAAGTGTKISESSSARFRLSV